MATGACGIDCSTCRLHLRNKCSSCGPATGGLAELKLEAQERLLGSPCPILACARKNRLDHCLADCDRFPCEYFSCGPYPFSQGFLAMQRRRRDELRDEEERSRFPREHWQALRRRNREELRQLCGVIAVDEGRLTLPVLGREVRVFPEKERVETLVAGRWRRAEELLALVVVVYLAYAGNIPLTGRWVDKNQLRCSFFFKGRHRLPLELLLARFGDAAEDFLAKAEELGAVASGDDGDAAVRLWLLPMVPVKLILWQGDEELPPALTVLFDSSIEQLLPADAIWAVVQVLSDTLLASPAG